MQENISKTRVTLTAESSQEALELLNTPYNVLRQNHSIPSKKQLAINYAGFLNKRGVSVQINLPGGGYTVRDEKPV